MYSDDRAISHVESLITLKVNFVEVSGAVKILTDTWRLFVRTFRPARAQMLLLAVDAVDAHDTDHVTGDGGVPPSRVASDRLLVDDTRF